MVSSVNPKVLTSDLRITKEEIFFFFYFCVFLFWSARGSSYGSKLFLISIVIGCTIIDVSIY